MKYTFFGLLLAIVLSVAANVTQVNDSLTAASLYFTSKKKGEDTENRIVKQVSIKEEATNRLGEWQSPKHTNIRKE